MNNIYDTIVEIINGFVWGGMDQVIQVIQVMIKKINHYLAH